MADGDASAGTAASAAGLAIMTGLEKVKFLWRYMNTTRDLLANHQTAGTHDATAITSGVLDLARIPTMDAAHIPVHDAAKIGSGVLDLARIPTMDAAHLPAVLPGARVQGNVDLLGGGLLAATIVSQGQLYGAAIPTTGLTGYTQVVVNSAGQLGIAVSSRRFKQNITPAPRRRALLAATVVNFRYRADVRRFGDAAPVQTGLIAEQLHELGLHEYVVYDVEERPYSIRPEQLVMDLLMIVQDHDERLERLEQEREAN